MQQGRFAISLLGPFRLEGPGKVKVAISSKKGIGLLAILATSANGERTRGWLQDRLWGSRGEMQASASLRRELSNLRKAFEPTGVDLIETEGGRVRLKVEVLDIDVIRQGREDWARAERAPPDAEFLEGLDIRGEAGFEEWLAQLRAALSKRPKEGARPPAAPGDVDKPLPLDATVVVLFSPLDERVALGRASDSARMLASQLVGQLARLRWLRVVALEATGPAASARLGPRDDPDACFILELSIVGASENETAEIRLLRRRSRELISTERMPLTVTPPAEPTVAQLVARLATRIDREEQTRAVRLPENGQSFRNLIWRGRWHVNRLTARDAAIARASFDGALALDPHSPEALIEKATALCWEKWAKRSPREQFREISDLGRKIMLLDPDDCRGYWIAAIAEGWLGNLTASIALLRRAIDIAPSFEPARAQLGSMLNLSDQPEEALACLNLSLGLSPNDTHLFFRYTEMAISWLRLQNYGLCVEWADRALILRPGYWYAQTIKIDALVQSGHIEGANKMGEEFRRLHPNFSKDYLEWVPFFDRRWVQRLWASVQKAIDGALSPEP